MRARLPGGLTVSRRVAPTPFSTARLDLHAEGTGGESG